MNSATYLQKVTDKLAAGGVALGTIVTLGDSAVTEALSVSGFDFIWIDMEHSPNGAREVNLHVLAARSQATAPFVRVPWNDPVLVKPILEMGPAGVILPFVSSAAEAERAVSACRYPPAGVRGFGPQRANLYGAVSFDEYLERAESEPWVIVQIEHIDAVRNLDDICSVPGIGSLFVGPFDLSASMGKAGQIADPEVIKQLDVIAETAKNHGIPFGGFASPADESAIQGWIERGASWLALGFDSDYLRRGGLTALAMVTEIQKKV